MMQILFAAQPCPFLLSLTAYVLHRLDGFLELLGRDRRRISSLSAHRFLDPRDHALRADKRP